MDKIKRFEERLYASLEGNSEHLKAALHIASAPAKRVRPLLLITVASLYGEEEKGYAPAVALELVHTYSLIHDDLPCMDDDSFRRGVPTLHTIYGEAKALLTGDFLLSYAFSLLSQAPDLTPTQQRDLIHTLSQAASSMVEGQWLDLEERHFSEKVALLKTATLFSAACQMGGIVAGSQELETLKKLGSTIGLLFQLMDDLQDGDHNSTQQALQEADKLNNKIKILLSQLSCTTAPLQEIIETISYSFKKS